MSTSTQGLAEMAERLDGLARENRQLRLLATAAFAATLLVVGIFLVNRSPSRRTIEAERLVIRDKDGRARATLGLGAGGLPSLVMNDERGNEQVSLGIPSDGYSSLVFSDLGDTRMVLDASFDGSSNLRMMDRDEKSLSTLFMSPNSTSGLYFRSGKQGLTMGIQPDGESAVFTTDPSGLEGSRLGAPWVTNQSLGIRIGPEESDRSTGPIRSAPAAPAPRALPAKPTRVGL